jgi:hypothetical protein
MRARLSRRLTVAALALLVVAAAWSISGCGDSGDGATTSTDVSEQLPPNVVSEADIDAQEDGSPQRALLEWWQAFQFGDVQTVLDLTDPATVHKFGPDRIEEFTLTAGQSLGKPKLLKTIPHGETASVRVLILTITDEAKQPDETIRTIVLKRDGGAWLVRPDPYFSELEQAAEAAE